jgi:hypothetical protein
LTQKVGDVPDSREKPRIGVRKSSHQHKNENGIKDLNAVSQRCRQRIFLPASVIGREWFSMLLDLHAKTIYNWQYRTKRYMGAALASASCNIAA